MRMKEIHALSGTRSRPALTRDLALNTRTHTPRSKIRAPHTRAPHHATLGHYFRIHPARIRAHYTRTLELHHTRTPLPDTLELRIRTPVLCAPRLHYFTVRAPDSCSLKDEHATNSWPELRIRAFLLLLPPFFFFLTNYYSHPEVRILLLRNPIPFRFCS